MNGNVYTTETSSSGAVRNITNRFPLLLKDARLHARVVFGS